MKATWEVGSTRAPARGQSEQTRADLGTRIERVPRAVRFALVGVFCTTVQLAILFTLVHMSVGDDVANMAALAVSTEANFVLSAWITWRERRVAWQHKSLATRFLSYNAMAVGALILNQIIFSVAERATYYMVAAALGVVAGAIVNYIISSRVVFAASANDRGAT